MSLGGKRPQIQRHQLDDKPAFSSQKKHKTRKKTQLTGRDLAVDQHRLTSERDRFAPLAQGSSSPMGTAPSDLGFWTSGDLLRVLRPRRRRKREHLVANYGRKMEIMEGSDPIKSHGPASSYPTSSCGISERGSGLTPGEQPSCHPRPGERSQEQTQRGSIDHNYLIKPRCLPSHPT